MRFAGDVTFLMTSSSFSIVCRASLIISSCSAKLARRWINSLLVGSPGGRLAMILSRYSRGVEGSEPKPPYSGALSSFICTSQSIRVATINGFRIRSKLGLGPAANFIRIICLWTAPTKELFIYLDDAFFPGKQNWGVADPAGEKLATHWPFR